MEPISRQFRRQIERRTEKRNSRPGLRPPPKTPKPLKADRRRVHITREFILRGYEHSYHATKGWRVKRVAE